MTEKKVLTIHLTDEWYQKIANGEKTEEYRECSLYWTVRLDRHCTSASGGSVWIKSKEFKNK